MQITFRLLYTAHRRLTIFEKKNNSQPIKITYRYSWRGVLEKFGSNYHVVAFDMRGYGDSDKPSCEKMGRFKMPA